MRKTLVDRVNYQVKSELPRCESFGTRLQVRDTGKLEIVSFENSATPQSDIS